MQDSGIVLGMRQVQSSRCKSGTLYFSSEGQVVARRAHPIDRGRSADQPKGSHPLFLRHAGLQQREARFCG